MVSVAVIGAGAVGSYYGALLARAGHDVRFLMRRDLAAVRAHGLDIRSHQGDFRLGSPSVFASSVEIGRVDWVVCSLKTTALGDAPPLIQPCLGPDTRLLFLMNGLGIEDTFTTWVPRERIFGGMAFVCINRGAPGVIHHLDYGRLTIGHLCDDAVELEQLRGLLAEAGIDVLAAPDLLRARWEKLCWNIPFNGLSVAAGGVGTRTILDNPALRETAERAMREVVRLANADLAARERSTRLDEQAIVHAMFTQTESMGDYLTSMTIDFREGRPLEVDALLGEPLRRSRALGVESPTIATIYSLVAASNPEP